MSLVQLANVCSHITNASTARLALTSIPHTNLHLRLTTALRDAGFLSTVVRGGPEPPPNHLLLGIPSSNDPSYPIEGITQENVASRRLWLGLKYWQGDRVLTKMSTISRPTRRVHLDVESLRDIVRGDKRRFVGGIRSPGECIFLSTSLGRIMEARECVELKTGGLALCRVV